MPERAYNVKDTASRAPFRTQQVPSWCVLVLPGSRAGVGEREWEARVRQWDEVPM